MSTTAKLYAGVARRIISPPRGLYLVGYGNRLHGNAGVHDDLTATALVLRSNDECVAIMACDVLAMSSETLTRVQSAVHGHVLVCCSHTHAAPMTHASVTAPHWYRRYVDFLVAQIVDVIQLAEKNAQPAQLSCAVGAVDVAVNRRQRNPNGMVVIGQNPDGPVDRSLAVVQVADQHGAVMATLVNMACHPTVLRPDNRLASADWPGVMRAVVEAQTNAPCLFVQGACGDLGPRVQRNSHTQWEDCDRLGRESGEAVLALLPAMYPVTSTPVMHRTQQVLLPLESPDEYEASHHLWGVLARSLYDSDWLVDPLLEKLFPWHQEIVETDSGLAVAMRVHCLRLGDILLVTLGAEAFTEIGLSIKAASPAAYTLIAGVTNGCVGYLPTAEEHALGGYEVDIAPRFYRVPARFAAHAAAQTVAKVSEMIRGMYDVV